MNTIHTIYTNFTNLSVLLALLLKNDYIIKHVKNADTQIQDQFYLGNNSTEKKKDMGTEGEKFLSLR